jgi:hypothetical protein
MTNHEQAEELCSLGSDLARVRGAIRLLRDMLPGYPAVVKAVVALERVDEEVSKKIDAHMDAAHEADTKGR